MTSVSLAGTSIADRHRACLSKGRASLGQMFGADVEVATDGAWITTDTGHRILNCGGYGVFLLGARHPVVVDAVARQLASHPMATRLLLEPEVVRAAEALVSVTPAGLEKVHFAGSGAEAVEAAIKMARTCGKHWLVSMRGGYHGKTMGALSVTGNDVYREPFRPLLPQVSQVPYGDIDALAAELAAHRNEACVVVEPVQGEGGVVIPPPGYLRDVARLCCEHGAFLVLDEIQTGMGRLGAWWGADLAGVTPDALLVGKGLSGGIVPVSAVVATREAYQAFDRDPFLHTSTFSGNPLAMAAVQGAIRATEEDGIVERARVLGARLREDLDRIARRALGEQVVQVRGVGLLIGIELRRPGLVGDLLVELMGAGVLANHSMNASGVLRLTPPAVLDEHDVEFLYEAFERAARAALV
ncbi:aspartate aminotransferase family protein [Streptomyces sp. BR123]|uniref:aspartate aminotransferase family protein n=1 Tax=Streptomyces sp. BR123 TaxID=2749828 RepID=UPI0015C4D0E7|nr:aminotransferase class III-fold pyridoxal phosphate-dependent enzyme [Streptomyces sp. BR123]NXY93597.1 aspartate aminotransferase family protein [Streptomyces sp. BR123]